MTRLTRCAIAAAAACGLFTLWSATAIAQAPAAGTADTGKGAILGTGTFTAFVENMDRSLAFYHDVFGMEVPALPESGARPYNRSNPQLFAMFDIPGVRERHQSARVPGTRITVEVMEIQDIDHQTIPLRIQDPGTATLVLLVRDIEAMLARVKQANVSVATPGGKPVTLADGGKAVLIRDIDNRFIEIRQPALLPEATPASTSNIVDMRLSIAVSDMDRTTQVYRDVLGFKVEGETTFASDKPTQALTGLSKAQVRRSRVQAPGSTLWIEFVEFKGVDRTPLRIRIQDRGAARLQLRAQNVDAMVAAMKSAGMTVVSQGGGAVPIPPNLKGALVADPNNFFLTPFAPAPAPQSARASRPTLTTQDYIDIQQLLNRYAFALDTCSNNGYDYADLYTPDGVFYWGINSRKSVGREELAEAAGGGKQGCKRVQAATLANPIQGHLTLNAVIEPSPEGAIGKSYLVYPGERGITADPEHTGHVGGYQDVYVKTAQGWRIKKRIHIFPPNIPGTYVFPADEVSSTR